MGHDGATSNPLGLGPQGTPTMCAHPKDEIMGSTPVSQTPALSGHDLQHGLYPLTIAVQFTLGEKQHLMAQIRTAPTIGKE